MSRTEENKKMIDQLSKVEFVSRELNLTLIDISKSLAIIADCCLDRWQKGESEE